MNLLDIIIIVTMIFLMVKGILLGFFREAASLVGIILGIWLANHYQPQMTEFLRSYLPANRYLPLISFASIFTSILVMCNLLGLILKQIYKKAFLGWLDRILGVGSALVKGVIFTYLVIVLLTFFLPSQTPLIAESTLAPLIIKSYQSMIHLISPNHYQNWKKKILGEQKGKIKTLVDKIEDMGKKDE